MKYRYSILTFNFGNYELFHEVENPQDDVEYIYVTDNTELKSNTWKIVIDETIKNMSIWDKCLYVRYNPFKYCSSDICIRIDGSMSIKSSLDKLIEKFNSENYTLALTPHPVRHTFIDEYNAWIRLRNYDVRLAQRTINYFVKRNYDFSYKSLFEIGFNITRKCKQTEDIDRMTYALLKYLSNENEVERVDQIIYSYILNTHFNDIKILPLSTNIRNSSMIEHYTHNTNIPMPRMNVFKSYVFNKEVDLFNIE